MSTRLNAARARQQLQDFAFRKLFIEELGWEPPASKKTAVLTAGNPSADFTLTEIAQLAGCRVFEAVAADGQLPDAAQQAAAWKQVTAISHENILIFLDPQRTRSLWYWVRREQGGKMRIPRRHHYLRGQPGDLFLSKLSALFVDISELDEDGHFSLTETATRVQRALDVETVTKQFFRDFQNEHLKLLDLIHGIPDPRERRWYASVLLNRLMFVWFMQEKGFLDGGNRDYLPALLAASGKSGENRFFSHTLRDLFFEGFAKPAAKRQPVGSVPLGDIPYLNGGLFLPHGIEQRIEGDGLLTAAYAKIEIPDAAFADLFTLFRRYTWSLNDTPGGDDREINPDVLGYIFEKYINQKEFGAYYTRPEITEYLCEQTIHQLVLDRANAGHAAAEKLHRQNPKSFPAPRLFTGLDDLLFHADGPLCARLLHDILPSLSLLDPACGSGAFLVAAQKTLLNLYTALLGRCEALAHKPVLDWIQREKKAHKAPLAYWLKKKIVTENLFGVDLMEEATEIAKLRLFLSLVASAEHRDQLEPLPNIEFNILSGNSLIGLLHVDATAFDASNPKSGRQQQRLTLVHEPTEGDLGFTIESTTAPKRAETIAAHLATVRAAKYAELLAVKNRLITLYKEAPSLIGSGAKESDALVTLRRSIEEQKAAARLVLDKLLLDEFHRLGIKFQQATWDAAKKKEGKPEKRALTLDDIRALHPFHWAYEFDDILITRGGFDAIITNPPWEIFKPNSKEFFQQHSELVTKNTMRIEDFEDEKASLLCDPEIHTAWLGYLSGFPHVSEWFRAAPQFENQISIVNGRKAGSDINLYKLFTEQCVNLLGAGGRCGIVIPSGIYTDLGTKQLRLMLFDRTRLTGLFGFENRKAIFEGVDSRFKFVVLSFEKGGVTSEFPVAFMRHDPPELASFPEAAPLRLSRALIEKLSPDSLSLLEFHSQADIEIFDKLLRNPLLGRTVDGRWKLKLTNELHMTNDSDLFLASSERSAFRLFEGKMIHQFCSDFANAKYWVSSDDGYARLGLTTSEDKRLHSTRYRFAFREIASNTNERTMLATILPRNVFANHKLMLSDLHCFSCAAEPLFLCAVMNSFTVDWCIRKRVTTSISMFMVYQLPIPRLTAADAAFRPLVERAARLVGTSAEFDDLLREIFGPKATHKTHGVRDEAARRRLRAELDALVARLYDLTEEEFAHILATFPLVDEAMKTETLDTFRTLLRTGKLAPIRS